MREKIKGVFCDFYGTLVHENGPISYEVVGRLYKSSQASSPEELVGFWWERFRQLMEEACGEHYRQQRELSLESFADTVKQFSSGEDPTSLRDRMEEHWCNPPLYEDTKTFLERLAVPVYFVTNSDNHYISKAMERHGLSATGVVTSESARYPKPREEIYRSALAHSGLQPQEVLYIGDSLEADVYAPQRLGIQTIWLNREGAEVPPGVVAAENLEQVLAFF